MAVSRFTLDKLAHAMRGMPRDAVILIRLPDGQLVDIHKVRPGYVKNTEGEMQASAGGDTGVYGIVLEPKLEGEEI